jgi:EAL domain-containing protein (putative c-di-GMP-specific phosphodiesterase class I)
LGEVATDEFIKVAEDRGLIVPLSDWILHDSCKQLRRWLDEDAETAPRMMCVNLSRVQFALGETLVSRVAEILEQFRLPPESLQLEITESSIAHDPKAARKLIDDIRALGVRIAMDDFGTGTSSLACLREYRFDAVKIDRSFLADLTASHDMLAILHTTVNLVENLGMASIAEGVESATQAALLQSLGCRYAQGFLYSEALPAGRVLLSPVARGARVLPSAG